MRGVPLIFEDANISEAKTNFQYMYRLPIILEFSIIFSKGIRFTVMGYSVTSLKITVISTRYVFISLHLHGIPPLKSVLF